MKKRLLLTGLIAGLLPGIWGDSAVAEVTAVYDPFENRTVVKLINEELKDKPTLEVSGNYEGRNPTDISPSKTFMIGFYVRDQCTDLNFIADGQRVEPFDFWTMPVFRHTDLKSYNFKFYPISELEKIATGQVVLYKLCKQVYTFSKSEQAEIKEFLSHFR